jgi:hypothetical protein
MSRAASDSYFHDTLERVSACLNQAGVRWMVFGGAAMMLHGHFETKLKDIDIIVTDSAASMLSERFSWPNYADNCSPRFRSDYLLRPDFGSIPVEIMGGFRIRAEAGWTTVQPGETLKKPIGSQIAHLPSKERLAEIFRLCGRQKDLIRADILRKS